MKVLYLSPTYFSGRSVIGGGERYALELAKRVAEEEEVLFLTFAKPAGSERNGKLAVRHVSSPASRDFWKALRWADVIHCHQLHHLASDLAIFFGKTWRKKVFVTDLGGGSRFALDYHLPILNRTDAFLLISEYSRGIWRQSPLKYRPRRLEVVYGGVDADIFTPHYGSKKKSVLFVGRLLPHKGIDVLLDAVDSDIPVRLVGRIFDRKYFDLLKEKSRGKQVTFLTEADDLQLIEEYRQALVCIQPSVYRDCYGKKTMIPELLGLAALEAMACGTPVIASRVASLPEIIKEEETGVLISPNRPEALRHQIRRFVESPSLALEMGKKAREEVVRQFTWAKTAERCLRFYREPAEGTS